MSNWVPAEERPKAVGLCKHNTADGHGAQPQDALGDGEARDHGPCKECCTTGYYGRGSHAQAVVWTDRQGGGIHWALKHQVDMALQGAEGALGKDEVSRVPNREVVEAEEVTDGKLAGKITLFAREGGAVGLVLVFPGSTSPVASLPLRTPVPESILPGYPGQVTQPTAEHAGVLSTEDAILGICRSRQRSIATPGEGQGAHSGVGLAAQPHDKPTAGVPGVQAALTGGVPGTEYSPRVEGVTSHPVRVLALHNVHPCVVHD